MVSPAWLSILGKALKAAMAPGIGERRQQGQATADDSAQKGAGKTREKTFLDN